MPVTAMTVKAATTARSRGWSRPTLLGEGVGAMLHNTVVCLNNNNRAIEIIQNNHITGITFVCFRGIIIIIFH